MNLKDKRENLFMLKNEKKKLENKKMEILNTKFGVTRTFLHLMASVAVFAVTFDLCASTMPGVVFCSAFGYLCITPFIFHHRKKMKVKILDVDIDTYSKNIEDLSQEIRKQEKENLFEMVSEENLKKQEEQFNEVKKIQVMTPFDRENIESNISDIDLGMKLTLRK